MGSLDEGMVAYERALQSNPRSVQAMSALSSILRTQENFPKAVEYLQSILKLDGNNGDVWGALGKQLFLLRWPRSICRIQRLARKYYYTRDFTNAF